MSNQAGEINDLRWLRHIKDNLSKNNRLRALYSRGIVWDLSRQTLRFLDRMKLACDREEDNNSAVSPIWVRTSRRSYLHFQRKRILNPVCFVYCAANLKWIPFSLPPLLPPVLPP